MTCLSKNMNEIRHLQDRLRDLWDEERKIVQELTERWEQELIDGATVAKDELPKNFS